MSKSSHQNWKLYGMQKCQKLSLQSWQLYMDNLQNKRI